MPNTKISALTAGNPALGTDQIPIARSGANFQVTAASIAALSPAGTVTSVGASGGTTGLTFSGQPITSSGTITLSGTLTPANGGTGAIGTPSNGQLLIGNGTNYSVANLTAGSNITITNSAGGISIAAASGVTSFSAGTTGLSPNTATTGAVTLSGTLALVNGGTGQTTKAAAFNALSPITTTGDLILGNGVNSSTRLAIGTNGYVLTSNGTTASWQAASGGGVTSFSAGSTGFNPSSSTTGAVTLSGTLNTGNGGTGTSSTPSNGQLLIGNGSGYSTATLTAGANITITNASGSITIAAAGGGATTISQLSVYTVASGTISSQTPSSTYSKPLIGYVNSNPSFYGAFFYKSVSSGSLVSSATITSLAIVDSTGAPTSYTSNADFSNFPSSFYVGDDIVSCYGLTLYNAGLQTLFSDSSAAITSPDLKPLNANNGFSTFNPGVNISTSSSGSYNNQSGLYGCVVSKSGSTYILEFGSNDVSPVAPTVTSMYFTINNVFTSTFTSYIDFVPSFAENTSTGKFRVEMTVSNGTLQTLLNNSFLS